VRRGGVDVDAQIYIDEAREPIHDCALSWAAKPSSAAEGVVMGVEAYLREHNLSFELLFERLARDSRDVVFVTGSIAEGTGDSESDLDVYVLTDEHGFQLRADQFLPGRRTVRQHRRVGVIYEQIGLSDLDIEVHLRTTFDQVLGALQRLNPWDSTDIIESFDSLGGFEHDAAVEMLHRLRIGKPCGNASDFEELRLLLDDRKFIVWNVHRAILRSSGAMENARRSLRREDAENAYLKVSVLYDILGDAFLFARGESIDRWKWRLPKLRTIGCSAFLEHYLDVKLLRRGQGESLRAFVIRQLEAAEALVQKLGREIDILPPSVTPHTSEPQ
jgi:predicted nucleotidyltransferase